MKFLAELDPNFSGEIGEAAAAGSKSSGLDDKKDSKTPCL
jgi:hypothetical protein